jgi:SAM-dependent methyltransferase
MIEAFYLGLYLLILSPVLIYFGWDNPIIIFWVLLGLSIPGLYAMLRGAPYLPTLMKTLKEMIKTAGIKEGDIIHDLGCGDGRLLFAASKEGATAIGYELSIPVYIWAKIKSFFYPRVTVKYRDFWTQDYKEADVIFCFLLVQTMEKLEKDVWPTLKPGCKVISNSFRLPNIKPAFEKNGVRMYIK